MPGPARASLLAGRADDGQLAHAFSRGRWALAVSRGLDNPCLRLRQRAAPQCQGVKAAIGRTVNMAWSFQTVHAFHRGLGRGGNASRHAIIPGQIAAPLLIFLMPALTPDTGHLCPGLQPRAAAAAMRSTSWASGSPVHAPRQHGAADALGQQQPAGPRRSSPTTGLPGARGRAHLVGHEHARRSGATGRVARQRRIPPEAVRKARNGRRLRGLHGCSVVSTLRDSRGQAHAPRAGTRRGIVPRDAPAHVAFTQEWWPARSWRKRQRK